MTDSVVILTGGVGGAKLVSGLCAVLPPAILTAIVNTGDDFEHLGLHISPDIDTLLYTLSGKANQALGWGREGESWSFMAALREIGGEDWFNLGDGDLALHVERTHRLAQGESLSSITAAYARSFGIGATVLPMSDDPVRTIIDSDEGSLPFQRYFVGRRCEPQIQRIRFSGGDKARAAPGVLQAIEAARTILIAPSNPYLSVDPILTVPEVREALRQARAPVVAVSPLIGGKAVKGPTAKIMGELGIKTTNDAIVAHYADFLDGIVVDGADRLDADMAVFRTSTLMKDADDRARVAAAALGLAGSIMK